MLHTLNATGPSAACQDCLRWLQSGDALLLLGDGVYAGLAGSESARAMLASGAELYALEADALAAGFAERLDKSITLIDYAGFVRLSERFTPQQAWY